MGAFVLIFLIYLLAIYVLRSRVARRFLLLSTALLGLLLVFCPVVTSQDIFSYIAYARMQVLYHLDPLTTVPSQISHDPINADIFWSNQPSIYGPVLTYLTGGLQEISVFLFGAKQIVPMVLMLRFLDLGLHLASVQLIWSILGNLRRFEGFSSLTESRRVQATLAFAWNPLLLFEACINAHTDTMVLFFLLVALWFFLLRPQQTRLSLIGGAIFFAGAICLKINLILLAPGFFLFFWAQRPQTPWLSRLKEIALAGGVCLVVSTLLYLPFFIYGNVLYAILVNPNTAHDANSLYEFVIRYISGRTGAPIASSLVIKGSPLEHASHTISYVLFFTSYAALCVRAFFMPKTIRTASGLLRWLALAWLLYCLVGSAWYWSWYLTTFFGLYALIETDDKTQSTWFNAVVLPFTVRMLAFTMVSVYCFYTWGPHLNLVPHFFHSQWLYLRGLWLWLLPAIVFGAGLILYSVQRNKLSESTYNVLPRLKHMQGFWGSNK